MKLDKKTQEKTISTVLIVLLLIWLSIAFLRTFFNISKIFFEEKQWLFLSQDQKKDKLYGDLNQVFKEVDMSTGKSDQILLFSNDGKAFFLLRYLLYPKKLYWINNPEPISHYISRENSFLLTYHLTNIPQSFLPLEKVKNLTSSDKGNSATLYKISWTF